MINHLMRPVAAKPPSLLPLFIVASWSVRVRPVDRGTFELFSHI